MTANAQFNIKGRIIDSNHTPLSNCTIQASQSHSITLSSRKGEFELNIKSFPESVTVTHIGYNPKTIQINENTQQLVVILQNVENNLQDILINTGYQSLNPNEVNGSYQVINNKTLNNQTSSNILDRLNGVTNSLLVNIGKTNNNPQNKTNISIRGLSTINGPLDPLIVLDNFIYEGDIANINPDDVESVTILKDASATSIWGARAGNGVIVITTKQGKLNQRLKISINSKLNFASKPNYHLQNEISVPDYVDFEKQLFEKGYYDDEINSISHNAISPVLQIMSDEKQGLISSDEAETQLNQLKKIDSKDLYKKYFIQKPITQQYSLNINGGSNKMAWLISGDYTKSTSEKKDNYSKINLNLKNTYKITKNLIFNAGMQYTNSTSKAGQYSYTSITTINDRQIPYLKISTNDGQVTEIPRFYKQQYLDTLAGGNLLDWGFYPLNDYKHINSSQNVEEILANLSLKYKIIKGLNINLLYQYQRQINKSKTIYDTGSYNTRSKINQFTQINPLSGEKTYNFPIGSEFQERNSNLYSYNFRAQLNYTKQINQSNINFIMGSEIRDSWTEGSGQTIYGYNENPLTYSTSINHAQFYPTIFGSYATIPSGIYITKTQNRFLSFFSSFFYGYNNKYLLSASFRKDGSNIFGANTNDKWSPLWSLGGGWVISNENFYNQNIIKYLKLSITYGVSGNVDLAKIAVPVANSGTDNYTNLPIESVQTINNPDLTWEQSYQTNIKLDFKTKSNILGGSFEYYHKKGTNLYGPTPYDYTAGGYSNTIVTNVADMKANGIDIQLESNNINRELKWNTNFIFNYNISKTTKYNTRQSNNVGYLLQNGSTINPIVGMPLYAIAAYKWGGLDSYGNPQGYLNNELTTDYTAINSSTFTDGFNGGSFKYIGTSSPKYFGSIFNSFRYRKWQFNFNITYKLAYYLFKPSLSYTSLADYGIGYDYNKRWKKSGDEKTTNVPSFIFPLNAERDLFYGSSEANIINGGQMRLQFINLSYTLNKVKRDFPLEINLFCNAQNIGIIWKSNKSNIDPDNLEGMTPPKLYTLGIKATF